MTEAQKTKLKNAAIGLAIVGATYFLIKDNRVRGAALGIAGVVLANNVPYLDSAVKGV